MLNLLIGLKHPDKVFNVDNYQEFQHKKFGNQLWIQMKLADGGKAEVPAENVAFIIEAKK